MCVAPVQKAVATGPISLLATSSTDEPRGEVWAGSRIELALLAVRLPDVC